MMTTTLRIIESIITLSLLLGSLGVIYKFWESIKIIISKIMINMLHIGNLSLNSFLNNKFNIILIELDKIREDQAKNMGIMQDINLRLTKLEFIDAIEKEKDLTYIFNLKKKGEKLGGNGYWDHLLAEYIKKKECLDLKSK